MLTHFHCIRCGRRHPPDRVIYTCSECGGNLDARYDYDGIGKLISRDSLLSDATGSIWRYRPFLPLSRPEPSISLNVGCTPLTRAPYLGNSLGLKHLLIKNDSLNPSASFKDRASYVVLSHCLENKIRHISAASTGNAGTSMACMAACAQASAVIFVPEACPRPKIAQLLIYGATVFSVRGDYTAAFRLCEQVSRKLNWFNRNTGTNPYTREGKKTVSFELWEQMAFDVPDAVVVSVGDGNIISGVYKGFYDLQQAGLIDRLPRIIGVQSTRSAAVTDAFNGDGIIRAVKGDTLADSISAAMPSDGEAALAAVKNSGGTMVAVEDEDILNAVKTLARSEGVFAEPSGAACLAGLTRLVERHQVDPLEKIVLVVTGSGLKDVEKALTLTPEPISVSPDADQVIERIEALHNTSH